MLIRSKNGIYRYRRIDQAQVLDRGFSSSDISKYRIVSILILDGGEIKRLTYYVDRSSNEWGHELYAGKDHIKDSTKRSYSRNFREGENMPLKYKEAAEWLMRQWELEFGNKYKEQGRPYVSPESVGEEAAKLIM